MKEHARSGGKYRVRPLAVAAALLWLSAGPAAATTVQALRACVQKATAQLPSCIRQHGKMNADPCRTGIMMEVFVCAEKLDPQKRHTRDPVRRKILYQACLKMHNPGTGQTAQQECDVSFPPLPK